MIDVGDEEYRVNHSSYNDRKGFGKMFGEKHNGRKSYAEVMTNFRGQNADLFKECSRCQVRVDVSVLGQ